MLTAGSLGESFHPLSAGHDLVACWSDDALISRNLCDDAIFACCAGPSGLRYRWGSRSYSAHMVLSAYDRAQCGR